VTDSPSRSCSACAVELQFNSEFSTVAAISEIVVVPNMANMCQRSIIALNTPASEKKMCVSCLYLCPHESFHKLSQLTPATIALFRCIRHRRVPQQIQLHCKFQMRSAGNKFGRDFGFSFEEFEGGTEATLRPCAKPVK
jgi:hypothetical protein